jgi:hypothetical protein
MRASSATLISARSTLVMVSSGTLITVPRNCIFRKAELVILIGENEGAGLSPRGKTDL